MRTTLKRGLAGLMAVSAVATVAPIIAASPAAALATDNVAAGGTINVTVPSGGAATTFGIQLTESGGVSPNCPGDGPAGYRWSTFLIPASAPFSSLVFAPSGAVSAVSGEFRSNLYAGSSPVRGQNPDLTTATITGIPGMQFNLISSVVPAGTYKMGVACHTTGGTVNDVYDYWAETVTITQTGGVFGYAVGEPAAAPTAPTITTVTPGDTQLTVAFGAVTANPAVTSYTATATPTGGGAAVTATGASGPLTITGLTNGTAYDVTVTATNAEGTSPASAPVSGTPVQAALDAPDVTLTPGIESLDVSWTAPTNGPVPTGYSVTASPGGFSTTVTGLSTSITGLTAGTPYTVTVTPLYSDATIATPGSATATPLSDGVLVQNIVASRPAGALVLTQDCQTDPTCTVNLTTGAIDASGTYYTATGTLYELTVSDTRDADAGWIVSGNLADTFTTTGDSFDSRALGWAPQITYNAGAAPDGYDPTPVAGATIAPNSSDAIKDGTAVLFQAPAGAGLGVARATAGLTLQIPVSAIAGVYSAQLAISVA